MCIRDRTGSTPETASGGSATPAPPPRSGRWLRYRAGRHRGQRRWWVGGSDPDPATGPLQHQDAEALGHRPGQQPHDVRFGGDAPEVHQLQALGLGERLGDLAVGGEAGLDDERAQPSSRRPWWVGELSLQTLLELLFGDDVVHQQNFADLARVQRPGGVARPTRPLHPRKIGEVLLVHDVITAQQLEESLEREFTNPPGTPRRRLGALVIEAGFATDRQIAQALAEAQGLELVDLGRIATKPDVVRLLPRPVAERLGVL